MKKQVVLSLLIIGMVFLSGCTGGTPDVGVGKGVSIQSFDPDFDEVRSGEEVALSALVENVGGSDATEIAVQLFGLNLNEWTLISSGDETQTHPGLRKADDSLGLSGEVYEFMWLVEAPAGLRVDNTYTANIRAYYIYRTSAVSTLRFMSYDYMRSLPVAEFEAAKDSTGVVSSTTSGAPVYGSVDVGNRPLVVYKNGDTYSIQITIDNVGYGNPFNRNADYPGYGGSLDSGDLYYVYVDIDTTLDIDCSNTLGNARSGTLRLTRGRSKTLFCTATIPSISALGNTKDYTVAANLEYGYFIDASTKIEVLKSESDSVYTPGGPAASSWACDDSDACDDAGDCPSAPTGQERACRAYSECDSTRCCCYRDT